VERRDNEAGTILALRHDGWRRRFRAIHHRKLALAADGMMLAGEDTLKPVKGTLPDTPYALRFHLHPGIRASISEDRRTVYLALPNRSVWEFTAGRPASLEESIFFASPESARRTNQIVVQERTGADATIAWTFRKGRG
jgi:uncharacterized heparinase superfamily protein